MLSKAILLRRICLHTTFGDRYSLKSILNSETTNVCLSFTRIGGNSNQRVFDLTILDDANIHSLFSPAKFILVASVTSDETRAI